MKKLVNKTISLTRRLSGVTKAGANVVNVDLKSNKSDKMMEEIERETTHSVFIKLMYQYISRKHLQFNK